MATTMKAIVCKKPNTLTIEDVPIPEPTGHEIRVRVKATSLCHSDLLIISGGLDTAEHSLLPLIPGHEAVSVVDKLGPDAASYGFREGDLVGASLWHGACLTCNDCKSVGPVSCPAKQMTGVTRAGTFAEFVIIDPTFAVVVARAEELQHQQQQIPQLIALSPLFCAGITVWEALERAELHSGDTVAIVGAGGLGELAVRYARALGYRVIALDVQDEQLEHCKNDTDGIINTRTTSPEDLHHRISQISGRSGVDVAIVTAGTIPAYQTALSITHYSGKLVAVGMPAEPFPVPVLHFGNRRLIGIVPPCSDGIQRCVDFSLKNNILPRINPRVFHLEDINEMLALMDAGHIQDGRMVIVVS